MKSDMIKNRIGECATLLGFQCGGIDGYIDPFYIPETDSHEYVLFFAGASKTVYKLDDVMNTPFINGKTLNEAANEIEITEW